MIAERLTASFSVEVELALAGDYDRGRDSRPGDPGDPGEPETVENLTIDAAYVERVKRIPGGFARERFDLLKGLDDTAKGVVIANLLEATGDDAEESLIAEAH